jgi:hypothetical protein
VQIGAFEHGARPNRTQEVAGSSPASSIKIPANQHETTRASRCFSAVHRLPGGRSSECPRRPPCETDDLSCVAADPSAPSRRQLSSSKRSTPRACFSSTSNSRAWRAATHAPAFVAEAGVTEPAARALCLVRCDGERGAPRPLQNRPHGTVVVASRRHVRRCCRGSNSPRRRMATGRARRR